MDVTKFIACGTRTMLALVNRSNLSLNTSNSASPVAASSSDQVYAD